MDLERAMAFVLQHQANAQKEMSDLRSIVAEIAQEQLDLSQIVRALAERQEADRLEQAGLRASVADLRASVADLRASVAALADAQRQTDDRVNALIDIVDGLVRRPPIQ